MEEDATQKPKLSERGEPEESDSLVGSDGAEPLHSDRSDVGCVEPNLELPAEGGAEGESKLENDSDSSEAKETLAEEAVIESPESGGEGTEVGEESAESRGGSETVPKAVEYQPGGGAGSNTEVSGVESDEEEEEFEGYEGVDCHEYPDHDDNHDDYHDDFFDDDHDDDLHDETAGEGSGGPPAIAGSSSSEDDDSGDEELDGSEMGLLEHLEDLRWTLIKSGIALAVGVIATFVSIFYVIDFLEWPLRWASDGEIKLRTTAAFEVFGVLLQVAFFGGIAVALPFIIYFVAQFVAPGLKERELRVLKPACCAIFGLFIIGATFSFFILVPASMKAAIYFNEKLNFEEIWTAGKYYGMLSWMVGGVGISFEFPLVVILLVYVGIVNTTQLIAFRPYSIVTFLGVAAIVTPSTDPFTFLLLAAPMYFLYEVSIKISLRIEQHKKKLDEEEELREKEEFEREQQRIYEEEHAHLNVEEDAAESLEEKPLEDGQEKRDDID